MSHAETARRARWGVAAIMRDERPYVLEWLAHHRALGAARIVVADNQSTDGTSQILAELDRAGILTHLPFPDPADGSGPQLPAYREILAHHADGLDWLGFLDTDEFLLPEAGLDWGELLAAQPDEASQVSLNWATYGSSGTSAADHPTCPTPVTQRFSWRGPRTFAANTHLKSFVRPGRVSIRPELHNPHTFTVLQGLTTDSLGQARDVPREGDRGRDPDIRWVGARVNHYVLKSAAEFAERKVFGPNATGGPLRTSGLFVSHDVNDVLDPFPTRWADARDAGIRELAALLTPGTRALTDRADGTTEPDAVRELTIRHAIEGVYRLAGTREVAIDGWAVLPNGREALPAMVPAAWADATPLPVRAVVALPRPDIQLQVRGLTPFLGFRLVYAAPPRGARELRVAYDEIPVCHAWLRRLERLRSIDHGLRREDVW